MISGLTWLAFKAWVKKAWALCKKYWQILLGISIPLVLMIVFRKKASLSKVLDRVREDHQKEVDAIESARQKEIEDIEKAELRMNAALSKVEEAYEESEKLLDDKKKKEVKKALKENKKDPDAITKRLAEITGFKIHVD